MEDMEPKIYTPYSEEQILLAFRRALSDLTDAEIFALRDQEAEARAADVNTLSQAIAAVNADLVNLASAFKALLMSNEIAQHGLLEGLRDELLGLTSVQLAAAGQIGGVVDGLVDDFGIVRHIGLPPVFFVCCRAYRIP